MRPLALAVALAVLGLTAAATRGLADEPAPGAGPAHRPGEWIVEKHSTGSGELAFTYVYTWVSRVEGGKLVVGWQQLELDQKTPLGEPRTREVELSRLRSTSADPIEEVRVGDRMLPCRVKSYPEGGGVAWITTEVPVYGVARSTVHQGETDHVSEVIAFGWSGGAAKPLP